MPWRALIRCRAPDRVDGGARARYHAYTTLRIKTMPQPHTFLWHDYETTGLDSRKERPTQFAAIRTDIHLNEIGEPINLICKLPDDIMPSPSACLVTGVLPQRCMEEGVIEAEFARRIYAEMIKPGTCAVGFNTLKFDDEFTRNLMYRNLRDPYEREWAGGNSRWDIIDMLRTCHAFRPEGIVWPTAEDGSISFKLEDVARANHLSVERAHDALSDVRTTIALARLIKQVQPKLFDHMLSLREKQPVLSLLQDPSRKVLAHVASAYGKEHHCVGMVVPIGPHPTNKNSYIVADLSVDPSEWEGLDAEQIAEKIKWQPPEEGKPRSRPFIRCIQANKCPALFSAAIVREQAERFSFFDLPLMQARHKKILEDGTFLHRAQTALLINEENRLPSLDPELGIYSGFLANQDKAKLKEVMLAPPESLAGRRFAFSDNRLETLVFRYRARNWPETLGPEELADWQKFCIERLTRPGELGPRTIEEFRKEIDDLIEKGRAAVDSEVVGNLRAFADQKQSWVESLNPAPLRLSSLSP